MCPNEPWPALRLPPFTSETRSRRSFHNAVASSLSRQIVHSNLQESIHDQLTFAGVHLIVKPSEEKLPQEEETDVDIAAEEFGESAQILAKSTPCRSTPSNESCDQFIRKRLIRLVMP